MNSNKDACVKWRALCILTLSVFVFFCTCVLVLVACVLVCL